MKTYLWPLFLLVVLVQWLVPAGMIWRKHAVLAKGKSYKFRTAPVDPINPFIGRYIILRFNDPGFTIPKHRTFLFGQEVYVTFKNNKSGFAEVNDISDKAPAQSDYLKTYISDTEEGKDSVTLYISYPFTRFYMEESKAPDAEKLYGIGTRDSSSRVYALVSLYNGASSIRDVYINDTSISKMLERK